MRPPVRLVGYYQSLGVANTRVRLIYTRFYSSERRGGVVTRVQPLDPVLPVCGCLVVPQTHTQRYSYNHRDTS